MADAQLPADDHARSALIERNTTFRELVAQHHALDEQLRQYASITYLTDQQQLDEIALKKKKLALKDRIEAAMRDHFAPGDGSLRPH